MSRGFDRVTDVWQLKIVQLFGAVRIPRRSFRTVLRPFFVFPFIFILPFPSLFFSHFASSSCVPAFGHTRPPRYRTNCWQVGEIPVEKSSAIEFNFITARFESFRIEISPFFFLLFQFHFFFYYKNPVILFILRGIVERDEINFKWFIKNLIHVKLIWNFTFIISV